MRVLIACEFSGIVREAFASLGHVAWSCDLLPSERLELNPDRGGHLQGDVLRWVQSVNGVARDPFGMPWDLMIAHPPCTYLANSGNKHLYLEPDREAKARDAAEFFRWLMDAPIPKIAVENPIMRHAVERVGRKQDQIIQPWQFGHGETKATCLWLKGLPHLVPTDIVSGRQPRVHHASPGPARWKERSRTLPGIAAAMAEQWGCQ